MSCIFWGKCGKRIRTDAILEILKSGWMNPIQVQKGLADQGDSVVIQTVDKYLKAMVDLTLIVKKESVKSTPVKKRWLFCNAETVMSG